MDQNHWITFKVYTIPCCQYLNHRVHRTPLGKQHSMHVHQTSTVIFLLDEGVLAINSRNTIRLFACLYVNIPKTPHTQNPG